jgi:hypothetical protein
VIPVDSPTPTATPDSPLPVPDAGQALAAYVRPSPGDPSLTWLELAAPQGRWAVLYDTDLCVPPAPWTNVWLARDDASMQPITVERSGAGMCALAQRAWTSDVPCATDGDGVCEATADPAGWPPAAAEPPPETPTPRPTPPPAVVPTLPVPRAAPAPPPPVPQVLVVVQTVVVAAMPTDTPIPDSTVTTAPVLARATARATPSPAPTGSASAALLRQSSPVPALVRQGTPRPTAQTTGVQAAATASAPSTSPAPDRAGLVVVLAFGLVMAAGLVAVAATLIRRRRYAPS